MIHEFWLKQELEKVRQLVLDCPPPYGSLL